MGSKVTRLGEDEERGIIRLIATTVLLVFVWIFHSPLIPTVLYFLALLTFCIVAFKDHPLIAKQEDLFKALTMYKRLLAKIGFLRRCPKTRKVWMVYWPTWFVLIVTGWIVGDSILPVVVSLLVPFTLGAAANQFRMLYLKKYLRQTCVHTKTSFKLRRKVSAAEDLA